MKSVLRYTAAGLALATVGIASNASAATDTASATAEILSTLQVNVDATEDTLDFGDIADDGLAASSNVTVSPTGVLTCGTDLLCSGTAAAPLVHVTGLPSSQVAISFPNASVALTTDCARRNLRPAAEKLPSSAAANPAPRSGAFG